MLNTSIKLTKVAPNLTLYQYTLCWTDQVSWLLLNVELFVIWLEVFSTWIQLRVFAKISSKVLSRRKRKHFWKVNALSKAKKDARNPVISGDVVCSTVYGDESTKLKGWLAVCSKQYIPEISRRINCASFNRNWPSIALEQLTVFQTRIHSSTFVVILSETNSIKVWKGPWKHSSEKCLFCSSKISQISWKFQDIFLETACSIWDGNLESSRTHGLSEEIIARHCYLKPHPFVRTL